MSPLRRLLLDLERAIYETADRASRLLGRDDHLRHDRDTLLSDEPAERAWGASY
ncbi:MAG: hypothetical protein QOE63_1429 [Acidimicrobiaceae bacterium]|jgi:hypothetical protein